MEAQFLLLSFQHERNKSRLTFQMISFLCLFVCLLAPFQMFHASSFSATHVKHNPRCRQTLHLAGQKRPPVIGRQNVARQEAGKLSGNRNGRRFWTLHMHCVKVSYVWQVASPQLTYSSLSAAAKTVTHAHAHTDPHT